MGDGAADEAKGRIKEAGGSLTGDDSLKREGKVDKATGKVKDAVGGPPTRPRTRSTPTGSRPPTLNHPQGV